MNTTCKAAMAGARVPVESATERTGIALKNTSPENVATTAIDLCTPSLGAADIEQVRAAMASGWVSTSGPVVEEFERAIAQRLGRRFAVATMTGTSALHTALLCLGIEPDDEVVVSTLTFLAPANAIRYTGAWPVAVDAEPAGGQIDPALVERFLTRDCSWRDGALRNRATGRRVRAILPVHILGHSVDMDPILEAARRFELPVVEDAAESLGARYKGRAVASLGNVACLSFNGNKTITTGAGGMIVTDDEPIADRARYLTTQAKDDPVAYVHREIGYNYRMPSLAAALGLAQLARLDDHVAAKRRIAARYRARLADLPGVSLIAPAPNVESSEWLSTIRIDPEEAGINRPRLFEHLARRGITSRPLWQPVHASRAHFGCYAVGGHVADRMVADSLSLPSSVDLTDADGQRVIDAVTSAVDRRHLGCRSLGAVSSEL